MEGAVIAVVFFGVIGLIAMLVIYGLKMEKKRKEDLAALYGSLGLTSHSDAGEVALLSGITLLDRGRSSRAYNLGSKRSGEEQFMIFDYQYTTGTGKNRRTHHHTVAASRSRRSLPPFTVAKEDLFSKFAQSLGYDDIDFTHDPEFSDKFVVRGKDSARIRALFSPEVMRYIKANPGMRVEASGGAIVWYSPRTLEVDQMKGFIDEAQRFFALFK